MLLTHTSLAYYHNSPHIAEVSSRLPISFIDRISLDLLMALSRLNICCPHFEEEEGETWKN